MTSEELEYKKEWVEERAAIVEFDAKTSRAFAKNQSQIMYRNFLKVSHDYFEKQNKEQE